jgi:hypothetical protein
MMVNLVVAKVQQQRLSYVPLTSCSCQHAMVFNSNLGPITNKNHKPLLSFDDATTINPYVGTNIQSNGTCHRCHKKGQAIDQI